MALFENFPYTNLHELNLDWLINELKKLELSQVLSVNGQSGHVILYQSPEVIFPEIDDTEWKIIRISDGVVCGIKFDNEGNAYIVNGDTLTQIYTSANQPPYPVTSVNGLTGAVTLFTDQYIRLPDLDDSQITNWTFFRNIANQSLGIQFDTDGKAYLINGLTRSLIYDANNPPPYPVTSVNGLAGEVELYPEIDVEFPDVDSQTWTSWHISRVLNNVMCGIEFDTSGQAYIINGNDAYPIYVDGLNDPSDFVDPEAATLELAHEVTSGTYWGIIRQVNSNPVGLMFRYDNATQKYEGWLKDRNNLTKLITADDIPSTSGVVSVNTLTGVVTLYGSNLAVSTTDPMKIDDAVFLLETSLAKNVDGNTCTQAIVEGDFVLVTNSTITNITDGLYRAENDIAANVQLTDADLTAVTGGAANALQGQIDTIKSDLKPTSISSAFTFDSSVCNTAADDTYETFYKYGRIRQLEISIVMTTSNSGWLTIGTIASGNRPITQVFATAEVPTDGTVTDVRVRSGGTVQILKPVSGKTYTFTALFIS